MKTKTAPQEFTNFLAKLGKSCPVKGWDKLPEWEAYKAGYKAAYNAAVAKANSNMIAFLERYDK